MKKKLKKPIKKFQKEKTVTEAIQFFFQNNKAAGIIW